MSTQGPPPCSRRPAPVQRVDDDAGLRRVEHAVELPAGSKAGGDKAVEGARTCTTNRRRLLQGLAGSGTHVDEAGRQAAPAAGRPPKQPKQLPKAHLKRLARWKSPEAVPCREGSGQCKGK